VCKAQYTPPTPTQLNCRVYILGIRFTRHGLTPGRLRLGASWWVGSCCSFKYAKQAVYRSFNAIFGKIDRIASDDVVLELFKEKCSPVLLYTVLRRVRWKSHIGPNASFQFVANSCFATYFNTRSKDVINDCQVHFHFDSVSDIIEKRKQKFVDTHENSKNSLCSVVCSRPDLYDNNYLFS